MKRKKSLKYKFIHDAKPVMIEWIDSMCTNGWQTDPGKPDLRCVSFGHLVEKTDKYVRIALNKSAYQYGELIDIPLVAIKKTKKLKV